MNTNNNLTKINPSNLTPSELARIKRNRKNAAGKIGQSKVTAYDTANNSTKGLAVVADSIYIVKQKIELHFDNRGNDSFTRGVIGSTFLPMTDVKPGMYIYPTGGSYGALTAQALNNLFTSRRVSLAKWTFQSETGESYKLSKSGRFMYGIWKTGDSHNEDSHPVQIRSNNIENQYDLIEMEGVVNPNLNHQNVIDFEPFYYDAVTLDMGDLYWMEKGIAPNDFCRLSVEVAFIEKGFVGKNPEGQVVHL